MHKKLPTFCELEGRRGLWFHSVERDGTFAPKTAVVGLKHLTHGVAASQPSTAR